MKRRRLPFATQLTIHHFHPCSWWAARVGVLWDRYAKGKDTVTAIDALEACIAAWQEGTDDGERNAWAMRWVAGRLLPVDLGLAPFVHWPTEPCGGEWMHWVTMDRWDANDGRWVIPTLAKKIRRCRAIIRALRRLERGLPAGRVSG